MKCPKCLYIGFETGDRCKNCGYDFSLLAAGDGDDQSAAPADLPLQMAVDRSHAFDVSSSLDDAWTAPALDRFRDPDEERPALALSLAGPGFEIDPLPVRPSAVAPPVAAAPSEPALPLFAPDAVDDEPLVKVPAVPRMPLSVRKTPDVPRLRSTPSFDQPRLHEDAVLQFVEEPDDEVVPDDAPVRAAAATEAAEPDTFRWPRGPRFLVDPFRASGSPVPEADASPFGRRVVAAMIDHGILLGIDLVVLYFTLRLTELSLADWRVLPMLPMAAFLLSLKVAYLSAFTTAGGQTIGKMATHIRVVADEGGRLDPGRALRRAVLGLASIATAGAPFLTALGDPARRGAHDRASGSRVVALAPR